MNKGGGTTDGFLCSVLLFRCSMTQRHLRPRTGLLGLSISPKRCAGWVLYDVGAGTSCGVGGSGFIVAAGIMLVV